MTPRKKAAFVCMLIAFGAGAIVFRPGSPIAPVYVYGAEVAADKSTLLPISANVLASLAHTSPFGLIEPVAQFRDRITKKTFGMHIIPGKSPIENDRFAGYHTGVDAEFTDTPVDIPVVAIADGTIVLSKRAEGYGGVVVVLHHLQGIPLFALYGHLDPASMIAKGARVTAGSQLGILGDDHSEETDGVRKHLHLSFYSGEKMDIRGYVPNEAELANWMDPLRFF